MKTKLVLWGTDAKDEKILIAMELRPNDNKVDIYTFPEKIANEDFGQKMLQEWRNDVEVPFPEGHSKTERELTVADSLLPDDIKVERSDIINRAQTEWHFIVLSSKLNQVYETELGELKEKVDQLTEYSVDVWDELKTFWAKVQEQVHERNLFRDHANNLRDNTNILFGKLKSLRAALDAEFQSHSKEFHDTFITAIAKVEGKANDGSSKLASLFEELKDLQRQFRDSKLTREHRSQVWEKLDGAFKIVKEKRFGANANNESSAMERLQRRFDGLINAISKMEKSIDRDKSDLNFQNQKIASTDGQLEAQIRQAKIKMIEERIRSKEEKLGEMNTTKVELEQRMATQKEKDSKRAERMKVEEAKEQAKEKIAQQIKAAESARVEKSEKLEKAAEAITKKPTEKVTAPKTETPTEAVTNTEKTEETPANEDLVEKVAENGNGAKEEATESAVETKSSIIPKAVAAVGAAKVVEKVVNVVKGNDNVVADVKETVSEKVTSENLVDNAVKTATGISKITDNEDAVNTKSSSEEEE